MTARLQHPPPNAASAGLQYLGMSRIGPYEVLEEIGRGGMGIVFRAVDPVIGRPVAIKTIRLDQVGDPQDKAWLRERLFREARLAGILSHPNIVTIYQIAEQDETAYIAMEFVPGPNLGAVLSGSRPLGCEAVLTIVRQIAGALDYAHAKGIVHRDIKPANILFSESGEVKITDFGVAKLSQAQGSTRTGVIIGTPFFMSPEQIQGKPVDGRADQFSLAVMVFLMLTGEKPFEAETLTALFFKIVYGERPAAVVLNPTLSAQIEDVLQKALAKEPVDRFATCSEFSKALTGACESTSGWRPKWPSTAVSEASEASLRPTLLFESVHHCPECHALLPAGLLFCGYCGVSLKEAEARAEEKQQAARLEAAERQAAEQRQREEELRRKAEEAAEAQQRAEQERQHEEEIRLQTEEARQRAEEDARQEEARRRAEVDLQAYEAQKALEEEAHVAKAVAPARQEADLVESGAHSDSGEVANPVQAPPSPPGFQQIDYRPGRFRRGVLALSAAALFAAIYLSFEAISHRSETPGPIIEAFTATPDSVHPGEGVSLSWSVHGADKITITPGVGEVLASGRISVTAFQRTQYTLTAVNGVQTVAARATVAVTPAAAPPPTPTSLPHQLGTVGRQFSSGPRPATVVPSLTATPGRIVRGGTALLSWKVRGASSVILSPDIGRVPLKGERKVRPIKTTVYTLTATGPRQKRSATATIEVSAPRAREKPVPLPAPKQGRIVWTGDLGPGEQVSIKGSTASVGSLSGALPGVPVDIELHPASLKVITPPGANGDWRQMIIQNVGTQKQSIVLVLWKTR